MICIHHSKDLDGWCSGAIVKRKYPDCKLIGWDYGEPIPELPENEEIVIVDISFPMKNMIDIVDKSKHVYWIDHHISAIKEYEEYPDLVLSKKFTAILDSTISACEGTWKFLFPEITMPRVVTLLGEYDTWRYYGTSKWFYSILPFQYGMRLQCNSVDSFYQGLFDDTDSITSMISDIIDNGKVVLDYQKQLDVKLCEGAFKRILAVNINGIAYTYTLICINAGPGFNSDTFKTVWDESKYDAMCKVYYNGKQWIYTLYTTKDYIDCSAICKFFGGGGHKQAAGFELNYNMFN